MKLRLLSEGEHKDAFGTHKWKTYAQIPTNADRIRAMTDEELAKTIHSTGECPPCECPYAYADLSESGGNITDKQCVECWLDWLKQEASI